MKSIITGGAGFIGSNLTKLLCQTDELVVVDDLSRGDLRFLGESLGKFEFIQLDIANVEISRLRDVFVGADRVFHIAANADVRGGWKNCRVDIDQNIIGTSNVAEAARQASVPEIIFTSTGCVYGDSTVIPTFETEQFPIQTSLYGASKVAAEGILSAYASQGAFKVTVLRFVSILGENYHHGHVFDFVNKLLKNPNILEVLGDGSQRKSYIHVDDCMQALIKLRNPSKAYEVFNIGHESYMTVKHSAELISRTMNCRPEFVFGKGNRGWVGDNPFTFLDISKAKKYGWNPRISIESSVIQTVNYLLDNEWVLSLSKNHR